MVALFKIGYGYNLIGRKEDKKMEEYIWVIKSINLALPEHSPLYIRLLTI
jgi:hypothetical protein